jgi:flagellar basal-body rod protein FlgB
MALAAMFARDRLVPARRTGGAMLDRFLHSIQFQGQALTLRADRQKVLSANIANADTPGYKARDFDFSRVLADATGSSGREAGATDALRTHGSHHGAGLTRGAAGRDPVLQYRSPDQASADGNTVELDRERANFADNAVRYEATLRFINGGVRTMLSAIRGE